MNADKLAKIERALNEIDAATRDDVASYSDDEVLLFAEVYLYNPEVVMGSTAAMKRACAMASTVLYREALRRMEVGVMQS